MVNREANPVEPMVTDTMVKRAIDAYRDALSVRGVMLGDSHRGMRAAIEAALAASPPQRVQAGGGEHREFLGKLVRMTWMEWAREQPDPKPSWLKSWDELSETDREVDRRIGERIYSIAMGALYEQPTAQAGAVEDAITDAEAKDCLELARWYESVCRTMRKVGGRQVNEAELKRIAGYLRRLAGAPATPNRKSDREFLNSRTRPTPADTNAQPSREAGTDFISALHRCEAGLNDWKSKPHNARWWKRIDGTPIPNDLLVNIANQFAVPIDAGPGQEDEAT